MRRLSGDEVMTGPEVDDYLGISRFTRYNYQRGSGFPKSVSMKEGGQGTLYLKSEIDSWWESRKEARK